MKKVLTIGGATQDIYLDQEGADYMSIIQKNNKSQYMLFKTGEKIEVKKMLHFTGGGATNSAVSFKRQGFNVCCFCKIGNDQAGNLIIKDLKKEKIDVSNIIKINKYPSGKSFIINSIKRECMIFAYRGSNEYLKKNEIPFGKIKKSDQIYITSLSNNSAKLLPEIVSFSHKNKIPVAINPGISQLSQGAKILSNCLKYIDILIMNSDEAKSFMIALIEKDKNYKEILKSSEKNIKKIKRQKSIATLLETPFFYGNYYFSIRKFFKEVIKMGPKTVVITDGENGVYTANNNQIFFHPSIKTKIKDTLGAGDSFGSCFVGNILKGRPIETALRQGIINAASVISKMGAKPGLLKEKELILKEKSFKKNIIQKFSLN